MLPLHLAFLALALIDVAAAQNLVAATLDTGSGASAALDVAGLLGIKVTAVRTITGMLPRPPAVSAVPAVRPLVVGAAAAAGPAVVVPITAPAAAAATLTTPTQPPSPATTAAAAADPGLGAILNLLQTLTPCGLGCVQRVPGAITQVFSGGIETLCDANVVTTLETCAAACGETKVVPALAGLCAGVTRPPAVVLPTTRTAAAVGAGVGGMPYAGGSRDRGATWGFGAVGLGWVVGWALAM
ncbi:hypothetical protein HDU96_001597 [Phlyctochytrium bullatum]|nr:hypothetical protein HDU96_001597 [Phlyctochytrium bullatum]